MKNENKYVYRGGISALQHQRFRRVDNRNGRAWRKSICPAQRIFSPTAAYLMDGGRHGAAVYVSAKQISLAANSPRADQYPTFGGFRAVVA